MAKERLTKNFKGIDASSTAESEQTLRNKERFWKSLKESIQNAFGVKPVHVHGQDDWRTDYYKRYLGNIIKSLVEVEVNAEWDVDYFKDILLFTGKICVTEINGTNYALRCGTHGVSAYDRSNYINIANPILGTHDRVNGIDGAMIYLMSEKTHDNYSMLVDIYACKLAMCDSAIDVNLMNSKVSFVVDCSSKKQADEAKMIYDKISAGEPIVFYETDGIQMGKDMNFFKNDVKQSFVVDMVQDAKRAIISEFLTAIGINNSAVEKKERLLFDEVNGNNMETMCSIAYTEEIVQRGVELANKLFPYLKLKITFPYLEEMRRREVMSDESDGNDAVDRDKRDSADGKTQRRNGVSGQKNK